MTAPRQTFVFGGARSGKSGFAEGLAPALGERIYIATAQGHDDEMRARIAHHRQQRQDRWTTIEEPLDLVEVLRDQARPGRFILIDCVTLWIANLLFAERDCEQAVDGLLPVVSETEARLVIVSNEVGLSIVPDNALSRKFRDEQGRANQRLAQICDEVFFIAAGLPLRLKPQER